jgi:uncharacterized protein (TIGR00730 family)
VQKRYCTGKADIDRKIDDLARCYSTLGNTEFMRQILTTSIKLFFDETNQADLKLINTSLKEMRHAFRVFTPYRDVKKVVIWGSSRALTTSPEYKMARDFSKEMVKHGFMVITGGGGGIMEAGNEGAGAKGFGINIELPMEQEPNPHVRGEKLMRFHYFFTRKLIFVKESDATVLFPGGFGTCDEGFEILTLAQTGKMMPRPIVFAQPWGWQYWGDMMKFLKRGMMRNKFVSESDFHLFKVTNSVKETVEYVRGFYRVYHSIRFVGPLTVLRLNKGITEKEIGKLSRDFSDILVDGKIESSPPRPEEVADRDHTDLFRLAMRFDKHNFGRLYELIGKINEL